MSEKLDAAATDPRARKLMQGFPPSAEATIRFDDDTSSRFPNIRWAFSRQRELKATASIWRGRGAASTLPYALRDDLDAVPFTTLDGEATSWGQAVDTMFTDGLLVLHRGVIVYERYLGALEPQLPHIAMSVTKSFVGLLAAMLAHESALDPEAPVVRYVPELAGGAYGDATVRQVMDMIVGVQYSEDYVDPNAEVRAYSVAAGFRSQPAGYTGPTTIFDFVRRLKKSGEHGQAFAYKTCNTEVLSWIVQRAADTSIPQLLSERIWQRLGAEEDAYVAIDRIGMAMAGAALNLTLRDLARFGEMMRLNGAFNGQQIVPEAVVADISGGGNRDHFAKAGYVTLPGWSYRSQWWVSHNALGAYTARGIHGQVCWIAPKAELVIARFASHPIAANGNSVLDRVSLPAYAALAEHLMRG
ncbi:MAG: serine hydrolase [Hyphomonadaceae bacterium]|nr:serine hydrolase [Hyphomonadaceae bacterium]